MSTKRKFPTIITPRATLMWCHLLKPDRKFNPDGDYSVTVQLPAEGDVFIKDGESFPIELLEQIRDEFYPILLEQEQAKLSAAKAKKLKKLELANLPWKTEEDEEGEETGNVTIRPKMKAIVRYTKKGVKEFFEQRPTLIDSNMEPVSENIGGGSEGKVKFEVIPYYTALMGMGITLRLKAVQVLELVPFGGNDMEGFEKEDGFESEGQEAVGVGATDDEDDF